MILLGYRFPQQPGVSSGSLPVPLWHAFWPRSRSDSCNIMHDGQEYDITPHVKHGNAEPKLVRVYFAFDEGGKKIVVGHIGRHIPNYTSKNM